MHLSAARFARSWIAASQIKPVWPEPLVIQPTTTHTHTAILLHGRGSNANLFGKAFLKSTCSDGKTLPERFPGMKFVFPTARKRRSTALNRIRINQWFDMYSTEDPSERQELQYEGLSETTEFIHSLICEEAATLGDASKVILGGLSNGCAAGLHVFLSWHPERYGVRGMLGGFVGMSGWLPFAEALDPAYREADEQFDGNADDVFERSDEEINEHSTATDSIQMWAANTVHDIVSLPPWPSDSGHAPVFTRTPILLSHGRHDEKISLRLGEQARDVLKAIGCQVQWKDYDEGHWYKVPEQIDDIAAFISQCLGVETAEIQ